MTKTMAALLAEHQRKTGVRDMKTHCVCGWVGHCLDDSMVDHVAAALSAAGYGLVADAKREGELRGELIAKIEYLTDSAVNIHRRLALRDEIREVLRPRKSSHDDQ